MEVRKSFHRRVFRHTRRRTGLRSHPQQTEGVHQGRYQIPSVSGSAGVTSCAVSAPYDLQKLLLLVVAMSHHCCFICTSSSIVLASETRRIGRSGIIHHCSTLSKSVSLPTNYGLHSILVLSYRSCRSVSTSLTHHKEHSLRIVLLLFFLTCICCFL